MKRLPVLCVMTLFIMVEGVCLGFAQSQMPKGEEIARAAKAARLNPEASATAEKDGKRVSITAMDSSKIESHEGLKGGQVVAVLDVKGIRELPDGMYNVFLIQTHGRWQALFESGGKIVKRDENVEVGSIKPNKRRVGTVPVIVMSQVDPRICFYFHGQWVCLVLNPLRWVSA